jgi:hypothetical protein
MKGVEVRVGGSTFYWEKQLVILFEMIFVSFEGNGCFPRLSAKLKGRQVIKMPWQKYIFARASLSLGGNEPKIGAIY